jgi:hypothetical protein
MPVNPAIRHRQCKVAVGLRLLLDRLLARLHRRKAELLRVLQRPEIPLAYTSYLGLRALLAGGDDGPRPG